MQGREVRDPCRKPGVRGIPQIMRMHERTDAPGAGEPPDPPDVRLEDVDRSALDELAEPKDAKLAFAGGDWNALPRPHALIPIQVIRRHGLFNPGDVGCLQLAP